MLATNAVCPLWQLVLRPDRGIWVSALGICLGWWQWMSTVSWLAPCRMAAVVRGCRRPVHGWAHAGGWGTPVLGSAPCRSRLLGGAHGLVAAPPEPLHCGFWRFPWDSPLLLIWCVRVSVSFGGPSDVCGSNFVCGCVSSWELDRWHLTPFSEHLYAPECSYAHTGVFILVFTDTFLR